MVTREEIRQFVDGLTDEERDELVAELAGRRPEFADLRTLGHQKPPPESHATWDDLVRLFVEGPPRDPQFADDLEAIHKAQPMLEPRDWPS